MENKFYMYKNVMYPTYLKHGHAADWIIPFAKKFCKGNGLDIGGLRECHFPGARIINKILPDEYDALRLPNKKYDYIFSSHTLEHIFAFGDTLNYWWKHLKKNGTLFLYLPHPDMEYWLPKNCQKHIHSFSPEAIESILHMHGFEVKLISQRDLFWSFAVVATRGSNPRMTL